MTTPAAGLTIPLGRTCPIPKPSVREQLLDRSESVSNALNLRPHCFSRQISSSSSSFVGHRDRRNELRPLLRLCQHARRSSASPGPVLDSQDAADSQSHSPAIRGAQNGDVGMYATALGGLGLLLACALQFPEASMATATVPATGTETGFPTVMTFAGAEPSNALSLPTWVIHVASVVEWVTAMALVWKYGDTEGKSAWKGLTWGMVPLLGGAMCACTWHFFYNAESLEVLVVLQAFLTVVGNFTMWAAAYRIWKLSREKVTVD